VTMKKNGSDAGSIEFATDGTGAFTCASALDLVAGDVLTFYAQAIPDATLADFSITLTGAM
jgi:hypothetical protein